jgi:hypothetical protein
VAIVLSVLLRYTVSDCPFGIYKFLKIKIYYQNEELFTTSGTYPWSFVTQIFHNGQPSHGGDHNIFEVMISTLPKGTLGSVVSSLSATLYKRNRDGNHKLCNII